MLTSRTAQAIFGRRSLLRVGAVAASLLVATASAAAPKPTAGKYYFTVVEVKGDVPDRTRTLARQLLEKELSAREQFTNDLGGADASAEVLKTKGMRGFEVSLRFESSTQNVDEPKAGKRGKQLTVGTRISVFGSEIPEKRLAFSGEGESTQIAEVDERRLEKEARLITAEVLAEAVRQAVDQAVLKLAAAKSNSPSQPPKKRRMKKTI